MVAYDLTPTWEAVVSYFLMEVREQMFLKAARSRRLTPESFDIFADELNRLARHVDGLKSAAL